MYVELKSLYYLNIIEHNFIMTRWLILSNENWVVII